MVHVEHHALRPFAEELRARREPRVEERARVGHVRREAFAALDVLRDRLLDGRAVGPVEVLQDRVVVAEERPRESREAGGVDEVRDTDAGAVRLRLVRGPDAA